MPAECSPAGVTYAAFWQRYLRAHSRKLTRMLHYVGSLLAVATLIVGVWDWRFLIAAPLVGYGFAWSAHAGVERNRPETFGHPMWSLFSDFRMLALALTGRLHQPLRRAGVR
jgi:hypothetical protein